MPPTKDNRSFALGRESKAALPGNGGPDAAPKETTFVPSWVKGLNRSR
jgi:hypothetical protein